MRVGDRVVAVSKHSAGRLGRYLRPAAGGYVEVDLGGVIYLWPACQIIQPGKDQT